MRRRKRPLGLVTKVRFHRGGRFHGIGTRVVLPDGYTCTFMGPVAKGAAIEEAELHRSRGKPSER